MAHPFINKYDVILTNIACVRNDINNLEKQVNDNIKPSIENMIVDYQLMFDEYKYHINNINSIQQLDILHHIVNNIIMTASKGLNNIKIDLQYSNPRRDWYAPGRPLITPDDNTILWFKKLGFQVTTIRDCFNVSSSCEFSCLCDGIGYVILKWINFTSNEHNNINDNKLDVKLTNTEIENCMFNANNCLKLSNIVNEYNIITKLKSIK